MKRQNRQFTKIILLAYENFQDYSSSLSSAFVRRLPIMFIFYLQV